METCKRLCRNLIFKTGYFILACLCVLLIRMFVFDLSIVGSKSMEGTLLKGDLIVINKLSYGANVPKSFAETPILGALYNLLGVKTANNAIESPKRLPGWSKVNRNEVVVFTHPTDHQLMIKRCLGLPGDTLRIINDNIYVNQHRLKDPLLTKYSYEITTVQSRPDIAQILGIDDKDILSRSYQVIHLNLTEAAVKKLVENKYVKRVIKDVRPSNKTNPNLFPFYADINKGFNESNYGPVIIPKKDMEIRLTPENRAFYTNVIQNFEHKVVQVENGIVLIDRNKTDKYVFKKNYYFMIGDNRDRSKDSRYWGFVPEEFVIGKAQLILYSFDSAEHDEKKFRIDRILKKITS